MNFILLISLLTAAYSAPVEKRSKQLKIDFVVQRVNSTDNKKFLKKSAASAGITVSLENEYSYYLAQVSLGTPGQAISVDIDTGSSDLWVPAEGTTDGAFNASASSTYSKKADGFSITYGDGSSASGDWGSDTLEIGGASVTDLEFGYATTQDVDVSILGVGFPANEASNYQTDSFTYDNLPILLKNQGYIDQAVYSIYLNSPDATSGSILFGSSDPTKYTGDLVLYDVVLIDDLGDTVSEPTAFFVDLEKVTEGDCTVASRTYPALVDSGTTLIYAPPLVAAFYGARFGIYNVFYGGYVTLCSATHDDLVFDFGQNKITVPFENILYKLDDNNIFCLIGLLSSDADYYILGDAFMRSAYVYYDLDNAKVGLAQASYS